MAYQIVRTEITESGLHANQEVKINNIPTEEGAISWLKSARQATINTEANGRYVTEVDSWTFNVLRSTAKGDKIAINYAIKEMPAQQ